METAIEQIRAFAEGIAKDADEEIVRCGVTGAHVEAAKAAVARDLLALLDSLPAPQPTLSADDARAVVREVAARELSDIRPFSTAEHIERIADRVAEKLAGRTVATPAPTSPERIPPAIRAGLDRYATAGIRTGSFLQAVLRGHLFRAFAAADPEARDALPAIVAYIVNKLPARCYGSDEAVEKWIARPRS